MAIQPNGKKRQTGDGGWPRDFEFEGKEDDDVEDMEVGEEEARETHELVRKILDNNHLISESYVYEECEQIQYSKVLQQAYQNRWYRHDNPDTYFIMLNISHHTIKAGSEITFSYGKRSNSFLVEK